MATERNRAVGNLLGAVGMSQEEVNKLERRHGDSLTDVVLSAAGIDLDAGLDDADTVTTDELRATLLGPEA